MAGGSLTDGEREALEKMLAPLEMIGSANDAEDHGYIEDARRMRESACERIRNLITQHDFLAEFFPQVQHQLDSGHILGFGWADLLHVVQGYLAVSSSKRADGNRPSGTSPEEPPSEPLLRLADDPLSHQDCSICSTLKDEEYACQKFGADENNTYLPSATTSLELMRDFRPFGTRKLQLWQCPRCRTWYLYRTDYEYLVNGSEDEEFLTRLTQYQAEDYLRQQDRE